MLQVFDCQLRDGRSVTPRIQFSMSQINVLLGRNRAGKTALCRLIAGLAGPATGRVALDGAALEKSHRPVAMVYQAFVNYPNWTVAGNIASPLVACGASRGVIKKKVQSLAALVRIDHLLDRMPHELSGGQQQRLALARALAKEPRVLLMDEPFVNIDYKLREELNLELKQLVASTGVCLVFTTSDPREALGLADYLVLLDDSEIRQTGDPLHLYREPAGLAAAGLMSDPGVCVISQGKFVRPEHISLEPCDGMTFTARVSGIETNGAETYLHADVMADKTREWVVKLPGMHTVRVGEECLLHVRDGDVLHLGDAAGG